MKKCIFIIFIFVSFPCFGQMDKTNTQMPFIEVIGTASKEVIPDRIFISIVLSDKVIDNENYTIQKQEEKLKNSLSKINIDLNNLFLADASSEIISGKKRDKGFKVTKEFSLLVKNSDEVSKVFKALYADNIKECSILKTESSKIDSLRKEVRIAAIKAAKAKAEYLLAAIGEQIGKPLEIREIVESPFNKNNLSNNTILNLGMNDSDNQDVEISFQKFTIKFSYYIKYSIK